MRHRPGHAATLDRNTVGRIAGKREHFGQQLEIGRRLRLQPRIVQERRREAGIIGRNGDDADVILPVQLGHTGCRSIAVTAMRVVKEEQDFAVLQRVRLTFHGNRLGRLGAAQMRGRVAVTYSGERRHPQQHHGRGPETPSGARRRPQPGHNRTNQYRDVAGEEAGTDRALHPREATAFHTDQLVVVVGEVGHVNHEQSRCEPCSYPPVARYEEQTAREHIPEADREHERKADLGPDQNLFEQALDSKGIERVIDPGDHKRNRDQDRRDIPQGGFPGRHFETSSREIRSIAGIHDYHCSPVFGESSVPQY